MKKLINNAQDVVSEMLQGFAKANPGINYVPEHQIIYREHHAPKVGLVSGGGSGHEPAHGGYVGTGLLDAAVAGNVFASPGPEAVLEGIRRADSGKGVLLIIKNYSGDIMNFQMAAELAGLEGIMVDHVVVKDDVAVPDSTFSTGRRGIAGTVFVHKTAGAKAELGATLEEVKRVALKCIANVRSMGMAMSPCTLPAVGTPGFVLAEDEVEFGMGIHGEPGISKQAYVPAKETAEILTEKILADLDYSGCEVAAMVNGLGATPIMELYIMYNEVEKILTKKGIRIYRAYVGNYMTSLDMTGCSLSLLKLDEELKALLDEPCESPALKR